MGEGGNPGAGGGATQGPGPGGRTVYRDDQAGHHHRAVQVDRKNTKNIILC